MKRTAKTLIRSAQSDQSLRWAHTHFVRFVMSRLTYSQPLSTRRNMYVLGFETFYGQSKSRFLVFVADHICIHTDRLPPVRTIRAHTYKVRQYALFINDDLTKRLENPDCPYLNNFCVFQVSFKCSFCTKYECDTYRQESSTKISAHSHVKHEKVHAHGDCWKLQVHSI